MYLDPICPYCSGTKSNQITTRGSYTEPYFVGFNIIGEKTISNPAYSPHPPYISCVSSYHMRFFIPLHLW